MRGFLPFFLGAALLVGCNCNNNTDDDDKVRCIGADCTCIGADCVCTDVGCSCAGADCECSGTGCQEIVKPPVKPVDPLAPGDPIPGSGSNWGWDPEKGWNSENVEAEDVYIGADGYLRPSAAGEPFHYMWLANTLEGYVSKYDTRTGHEVARYLVIVPWQCAEGGLGANCAQENNELVGAAGPVGSTGRAGLRPSRTAIDYNGDAWVGNRASIEAWEMRESAWQGRTRTEYASVTKIANVVERCRNGGARTSFDRNRNGVIDDDEWYHPGRAGFDWNDWNSYDDCVLFTTPVCSPVIGSTTAENAGVRALAVSPGRALSGDAWAGCWSDSTLVRLHGDSGRVLYSVGLDIRPYGAIADKNWRVWAVQKEGEMVYRMDDRQPRRTYDFALQAVDTRADPLADPPENPLLPVVAPNRNSGDPYDWCSAYGIGLDGQGRIWLGGRFTEGVSVCSYDPQTDVWRDWGISLTPRNTNTPDVSFGLARGIAVDTEGWVYFSGNGGSQEDLDAREWSTTRSQLMVIDSSNGEIIDMEVDGRRVSAYDAGDPNPTLGNERGAIGVGLDTENRLWMVNHTGTALRFVPDHTHRVVRLDLNTRNVPASIVGGPAPSQPFPQEGLYTYSDFTGYQLRNYTPAGRFRRYLTHCSAEQTPIWHALVWAGRTPPGSSIRVEFSFGTEAQVKSNTGRTGGTYVEEILESNGDWSQRRIQLKAESAEWMSVTFHLEFSDSKAVPVLESFDVYAQCQNILG